MAIVTRDLGPVTAYKYAVAGGYEGTEEDFAEDVASLGNSLSAISQLQSDVEELQEGTSDDIGQLQIEVAELQGEVTENTTWESVINKITFRAGTNCTSAQLLNAYKLGKLLFIRFSINAASNVDNTADVYINVTYSSGIPKCKIYNYVIGTIDSFHELYIAKFQGSYFDKICCTCLTGSISATGKWPTSSLTFTGVIPLE